jgi:hypothetical protein
MKWKDLINAQFPMLNSHPRGHALCGRCSSRMTIEHWELSIGHILLFLIDKCSPADTIRDTPPI